MDAATFNTLAWEYMSNGARVTVGAYELLSSVLSPDEIAQVGELAAQQADVEARITALQPPPPPDPPAVPSDSPAPSAPPS